MAKKAVKFPVRCLENFRDKHTGEIHKAGDIFKVSEERYNEILAVGALVEKQKAPAKDEE